MRALLSVTLMFAVSMSAFAQGGSATAPAQTTSSAPVAKADDVRSIDAIIAALYDVISGPAGKKRDWDRFRSLFAPSAQMSAVGQGRESIRRVVMTPEDYITRSGPVLEERGFFENEAARRTEAFGNMAHVWSTYESRSKADDEKPFQRGINSIQVMNDGKRWWIVSVFWQGEDANNKLPEKYLTGKSGDSTHL